MGDVIEIDGRIYVKKSLSQARAVFAQYLRALFDNDVLSEVSRLLGRKADTFDGHRRTLSYSNSKLKLSTKRRVTLLLQAEAALREFEKVPPDAGMQVIGAAMAVGACLQRASIRFPSGVGKTQTAESEIYRAALMKVMSWTSLDDLALQAIGHIKPWPTLARGRRNEPKIDSKTKTVKRQYFKLSELDRSIVDARKSKSSSRAKGRS